MRPVFISPLPYLSVQLQTIQLSLWRNHKYRWAAWAVTRDDATVFKLSDLSSSLILTKELNFLKDPVMSPALSVSLSYKLFSYSFGVRSVKFSVLGLCFHTVFTVCESIDSQGGCCQSWLYLTENQPDRFLSEALGSAFRVPFYEY